MKGASMSEEMELRVERGAKALCELMDGDWNDKGTRALFRLRAEVVLEASNPPAGKLPALRKALSRYPDNVQGDGA
jgi:hypothetical protein